jgi:radical SAM superfamily enzyme YgiQ (UPF0313 family)
VESEGGSQYIRNKPRVRIKKLDELPAPAYDMLDIKKYRPIIGNFKRLPSMMLVSSRGCPWSCNFCRRTVGKMWTYRSAESLYDEFKMLNEQYGIRDIAIMDDVFTVNKQRVMDFCNLLIEKPLDILWQCFARVDIVDEEMLMKMKKAGCWGVMYGVENFNQEILESLKKDICVDQIKEAMKWAKKAGLQIRACLMVGNEGDTPEILDNNMKKIIALDPDLLSVAILTPNPGNQVFNKAIREDRLLSYNWDLYYGATPLVKIDSMSPEDTLRTYRKMTFDFYFRFGYMVKRLFKMKSPEELFYNIVGGLGMLRFYLEKLIGKKAPVKASGNPVEVPTQMQSDRSRFAIDTKHIRKLTLNATPETAIT